MGLHLLLLLSQNKIADFHTELETIDTEDDMFVQYPVMLEKWLMEGSYDKVWNATRAGKVPADEYKIFSSVILKDPSIWLTWQILVDTIRNEVASCSEKAYPSLPIRNAKNLLFLESDKAVSEFGDERGWQIRNGRIFFPKDEGMVDADKDMGIANTLEYARELETIV